MKEETDDDNNGKAFDFVIESQKSEVQLGKERCKKVESEKSIRKEKEKGMMRAEEKNLTEISEKKRNKNWSSNREKIEEIDSLDNMEVTNRTEPIVKHQERQNITVKDHKINNITLQTDNTIITYIETTKEVYIEKQAK